MHGSTLSSGLSSLFGCSNADAAISAADAGPNRAESLTFFPALDGLRWFAFTLVFLNHYISLPWAFAGVNIFFVISGFLITGILVDTRKDTFRLRNFYARRTLRIFPLFYVLIFGFAVTRPLFHWQWDRYWLAWPLYLGNFLCLLDQRDPLTAQHRLFASNGWLHAGQVLHHPVFCASLWSLCVEEQFYLFWPFLVYAVRRQSVLLRLCIGGVCAIPLLRFAAQTWSPRWMVEQHMLYRVSPFRVDSLLLGAALALLWRGQYRQQLRTIATWLAPIMSAVSLLYFAFTLHRFTFTGLEQYVLPRWAFTFGLLWIDLLSASLVVLCLTLDNRLSRLFSTPLLRSLGRLTYGAYIFHDLFHPLLLGSFSSLAHRLPATFGTCLFVLTAYAITFCLAALSFRFIEAPFLRLKDKFTVRGVRCEEALPYTSIPGLTITEGLSTPVALA